MYTERVMQLGGLANAQGVAQHTIQMKAEKNRDTNELHAGWMQPSYSYEPQAVSLMCLLPSPVSKSQVERMMDIAP